MRPVPKAVTPIPCDIFLQYENGRPRAFKYDVNALADFEQEVGMGFAQLMGQKAAFATARAFFWAGLKHEDRMLTLESVGDLLFLYISDVNALESQTINDALMVAFKAARDQGALGKLAVDDEGDVTAEEGVDPNKKGDDPLTLGGKTSSSEPTALTPVSSLSTPGS